MKKFSKISAAILMVVILLTSCQSKTPANEDTTVENKSTATITIECKSILENESDLKAEKKDFVPKDGIILEKQEVEIKTGENAFDMLKEVLEKNNIQFDHEYSSSFQSEYVKGINQLYGGDCGDTSGWTFYVNGEMSQTGVSQTTVNDGDEIVWSFVCKFE